MVMYFLLLVPLAFPLLSFLGFLGVITVFHFQQAVLLLLQPARVFPAQRKYFILVVLLILILIQFTILIFLRFFQIIVLKVVVFIRVLF
jgi:hypothetical protein